MKPEPRTPPQQLWQYVFLWIGEASNLTALHSLDVDRIKAALTDLAAIGERPSDADMKRFLADAWGPYTAGTQQEIRSIWRLLLRNPRHRFRIKRRPGARFFTLDRLSQEHGLPPLEDRLHERGVRALEACVKASDGRSVEEFEAAQEDLGHVAKCLADLRRLRYGPTSVGGWWDEYQSDGPPRGTRGVITAEDERVNRDSG